MSAKEQEIAREIDLLQHKIDMLDHELYELAKKHIPDFHFMHHKVSTFWNCDKSPIGKCVWDVSERGYHIDVCCHYCNQPVERK